MLVSFVESSDACKKKADVVFHVAPEIDDALLAQDENWQQHIQPRLDQYTLLGFLKCPSFSAG